MSFEVLFGLPAHAHVHTHRYDKSKWHGLSSVRVWLHLLAHTLPPSLCLPFVGVSRYTASAQRCAVCISNIYTCPSLRYTSRLHSKPDKKSVCAEKDCVNPGSSTMSLQTAAVDSSGIHSHNRSFTYNGFLSFSGFTFDRSVHQRLTMTNDPEIHRGGVVTAQTKDELSFS